MFFLLLGFWFVSGLTINIFKGSTCGEIYLQFVDIKTQIMAKHKTTKRYDINNDINTKPSRENRTL
jgi:hypothetical protein